MKGAGVTDDDVIAKVGEIWSDSTIPSTDSPVSIAVSEAPVTSHKVFTAPVVSAMCGCVGMAVLMLWNDWKGREALLLDMGKGSVYTVVNFFLWGLAIPGAIFSARWTKTCVHDHSNSCRCQEEIAHYWKRSNSWSNRLAVTVWCLLVSEGYVFFKEDADPTDLILAMPMFFLGLFITSLFRYLAMVARLVQASITAAIEGPAASISAWIDDKRRQAGWEDTKKVTKREWDKFLSIGANPLNFDHLLLDFYDGIEMGRDIFKDFNVFFHAVVIFSFVYVFHAIVLTALQAFKLDFLVKVNFLVKVTTNGTTTGPDVYVKGQDQSWHHAANHTHDVETVAEQHFNTVLLMVLHLVYLAAGIYTLFETILVMGNLNSTRQVSKSAFTYFRIRRRMTDHEKQAFFRFVNMMDKLETTSPIARLFGSVPVTRAFVFRWITLYLLKLPFFCICVGTVVKVMIGSPS